MDKEDARYQTLEQLHVDSTLQVSQIANQI